MQYVFEILVLERFPVAEPEMTFKGRSRSSEMIWFDR